MDTEELKITASLAMLELSETEELLSAFSEMLEYLSVMAKVDVADLEPTTHAILKDNRVREDSVTRQGASESLLSLAPEREDRFIRIPNVINPVR